MNRLTSLRHLRVSPLFGLSKSQQITRAFSNTKVVQAGFAKDFLPGPYPNTEEERVAAARKYGLRPEDYKPFPDDGMGYGDYPNLPPISTDMKSDFEQYDDQVAKRNFGEPLPILAEQLLGDKVTLRTPGGSLFNIAFYLILGATIFIGLNYYFIDNKLFIPVLPKQYPRDAVDGAKHYKI